MSESLQRNVEVNQQQVYFLKRTFLFQLLFFFLHETDSLSLACVRQTHIIWMPVLHTSRPAWHERTKQTQSKISVCHEAAQETQTHIKLHEALWHLYFLKPAMFMSLSFLPLYCFYILIHRNYINTQYTLVFSPDYLSPQQTFFKKNKKTNDITRLLETFIFREEVVSLLNRLSVSLVSKTNSSSSRMNSGPLDRSLCRRILQTKSARPLGDPPRPSFAAEEHTRACSSKTIVCREN